MNEKNNTHVEHVDDDDLKNVYVFTNYKLIPDELPHEYSIMKAFNTIVSGFCKKYRKIKLRLDFTTICPLIFQFNAFLKENEFSPQKLVRRFLKSKPFNSSNENTQHLFYYMLIFDEEKINSKGKFRYKTLTNSNPKWIDIIMLLNSLVLEETVNLKQTNKICGFVLKKITDNKNIYRIII